MKKSSRTRNYATIVYEESAPLDWLEILKSHHIPCFVSPIHNNDMNENGYKKPHYHIMILFDSVKTREQATDLFSSFGGVGCEVVHSPIAYARYLCHLDDKDKAQYNIENVISYGGLDYKSYIVQKSDNLSIVKEMLSYCRENYVTSYAELVEYALMHRDDWLNSLCSSTTYIMKEYIRSKYWNEKK